MSITLTAKQRLPQTQPETKRFVAVRKWKGGGEQVAEWFEAQTEALAWIAKQRKPHGDEFQWCVGEF